MKVNTQVIELNHTDLMSFQERVASSTLFYTSQILPKVYVHIILQTFLILTCGQGDIGAACTSVVTEFRPKKVDQDAPITMEVEYLSPIEREELLEELIWSFRRKYLPDAEDDDVIESEYAKMQRESAEAWSSLEAAFSHHEGFSKDWLTEDMTEEGLAIVTGQIIQWSHELNWPASADSGKWTSTADTADECYEKTSVFMQDQFWPFTKIIR